MAFSTYKPSRTLQAVAHEPGVDILAFETVSAAVELRAISRLLRTEGAAGHLPAWVSCSCRDAARAGGGASLAGECLPAVLDAPAVAAFGVNCTAPQHVAPLLRVQNPRVGLLCGLELNAERSSGMPKAQWVGLPSHCSKVKCSFKSLPSRTASCYSCASTHSGVPRGASSWHCITLPPLTACQGLHAERQLRGRADVHLLAYPNAGEAWDASARAWRPGTGLEAGAFGAAAAGWADAGATLIGGVGHALYPADHEISLYCFILSRGCMAMCLSA